MPSSAPRRLDVCPVSAMSPLEERANWITHGLGLLLVIAGTVVMAVQASLHHTAWHIVGASIFGGSLVVLYGTSTLYHGTRRPRFKRALRVADHSAIFLLIAGTYTPFTLVTLRGGWGWSLFGVVWGLAVVGIVFKLFFTGRAERISVAFYVGLGWLGVVAVVPLVQALPLPALAWLVGGGLAYTAGAAFFYWDQRVPFFHAVFHVFVLAGSACHIWVVLHYLLAKPTPA